MEVHENLKRAVVHRDDGGRGLWTFITSRLCSTCGALHLEINLNGNLHSSILTTHRSVLFTRGAVVMGCDQPPGWFVSRRAAIGYYGRVVTGV